MLKVYLAGPMRGYPDFNFPAFKAAAKYLRSIGHEVFSPAEKDEQDYGSVFHSPRGDNADIKGFSLRDALGKDHDYIARHAEAIALLPGWEYSDGALSEWSHARAHKHHFIYLRQEEYQHYE